MKNQQYTARWACPGQPSIGNVSFAARSDYHAKLQADKIAREIGLSHTPRQLSRGALCIETLQTGTTEN